MWMHKRFRMKHREISQLILDSINRTDPDALELMILRAVRIGVNLQRLEQEDAEGIGEIRADFTAFVTEVLRRWGSSGSSMKQLTQCAWLVMLFLPEGKSSYMRLLKKALGLRFWWAGEPPQEFWTAAGDMVRWCAEKDMRREWFQAVENLRNLVRKYLRANRGQKRKVILVCLRDLHREKPELAEKICEEFAPCFTGTEELAAFAWEYALTARALNKKEAADRWLECCGELYESRQGEDRERCVFALALLHSRRLEYDRSARSEVFLRELFSPEAKQRYGIPDAHWELLLTRVRSVLLRHDMRNYTLKNHAEMLRDHYRCCVSGAGHSRDGTMSLRCAENMMSAYYLELGEYLLAEQHKRAALEAVPPPGTAAIPDNLTLVSELVSFYLLVNDREQVEKFLPVLQDRVDEKGVSDEERLQWYSVICTARATLGQLKEEDKELFRELVRSAYKTVCRADYYRELREGGLDLARALFRAIGILLEEGENTPEQLRSFLEILDYYQNRSLVYEMDDELMVDICWQQALIHLHRNDPEAARYANMSLNYCRNLAEFGPRALTSLRMAATAFYRQQDGVLARTVARSATQRITEAWQNVTAYLNDHRICQVLAGVPRHYNVFYAMEYALGGPEAAYDQLLRFKDLPALVGRERNRFLQGPGVDRKLLEKVRRLQDALTEAKMADALRGGNTAEEISRKLRQAETEFAETFPRGVPFTEISLGRLFEKLKPREAVIEYYFSCAPDAIPGEEMENPVLDIFLLTRKDGVPRLDSIRIADGGKILRDALAFTDTMHNAGTSPHMSRQDALRQELYDALLAPVVSALDWVEEIYLAPDRALCNLPFEILFSDDSGMLPERFRVSRLICGRDLLYFEEDGGGGSGCFVLGDPDYMAAKGEQINDRFRGSVGGLEPVPALPFSAVEARRVAGRCRTGAVLGREATKYALQEAGRSRIIHLATHAQFDHKFTSDSLYSSSLIFAGYNHWLRTGRMSVYCGNGLLTADEISRMDLRGTQLVVLSACNSAMADYSSGSIQGLLSAFSAAGVRWVVTHIWQARDLTTPILMDALYDAYLRQGMDVPEALCYARDYLCRVSVGKLRENGWLDPVEDPRLSAQDREELERLSRERDRRRPFADECFWGGFICHRCK